MASGVGVNPNVLETFQRLKLGKKLKYITFKLADDLKEIIVAKESESADYDDFLNDLPEDECRWAVYDIEFEKEGAGKRNKLIFVHWVPENAKTKQKMIFASSKDALRKSFVGIGVEVQGTEIAEVAYTEVLEKAKKAGQ